eukprot:TRINITY_DN2677_c0_g1_i1.p4 TRINITY_DN2677_c0_g1~~TRINITY_DN2677_c0_g1_i1.p4  ORF type:complete len:50 (-),score=12.07 TRINITY_DN2677_c0_g1_i1:24-173(-)
MWGWCIKGALGDPCAGSRCPCYSSGKGCSDCGCRNCKNPAKEQSKKRRN